MIQTLIFPKLPRGYEVLIRKNVKQCISQNSFYTKTGSNRQVILIDQLRSQLPHKNYTFHPLPFDFLAPSNPSFAASIQAITLNPLPLCSSMSHKYNNYGKTVYIVSFYQKSICLPPGQINSSRLQVSFDTLTNTF